VVTKPIQLRSDEEELQERCNGWVLGRDARRGHNLLRLGTSRARGLLFYRLLQQATDTDPHPLSELIGGTGNDWDEPADD
jgi:hypothetical protein